MTATLEKLAKKLGDALKKHEYKLATAESCTAGGLAYAITMIPNSSNWFERGFITYSNLSKEELLGVSSATLGQYGAVSEQTAREMAEGALRESQAQVSVAITGIAGPDGGTTEKPVGTVWFAWTDINKEIHSYVHIFSGDRAAVREQSIATALTKLIEHLENK